ncbi:MAG: D-alanine--D-alanine ligase [Verrucomicrobiota bacterium]
MNALPPLTITVLLGGPSAEREVSLKTGQAVAKALRSVGHRVHEIDPDPRQLRVPPDTEVVFLALHGTYGEDGTVQAQLEDLGLPYTGCDRESSRLAFDKVLTKKRCLSAGVPTARYAVLTSPSAPWPNGWAPPVVLKPVRQGSSVGLQFVDRVADWGSALAESFRYDAEVLMEERVVGRETTVAILNDRALPIVEIRPKQGAYDYQNKYTPGRTEYLCPAPFDADMTQRIQAAGLEAFRAVGGRDYGRIDIMVHESGVPFVLEVNTLPGMTETSLLPKAAAAAGLSYAQLCQEMISLAWRRSARANVRSATGRQPMPTAGGAAVPAEP